MSDIDKIIMIAGNNTIKFLLVYCVLNIVIVLCCLFVIKFANKRKDINDDIGNQNPEIEDDEIKLEIEKILNKWAKDKKIKAYVFLILFCCFLFLILLDMYNVILNKSLLHTIFGAIILLSMYTSIQFFDYFIKPKIDNNKTKKSKKIL